ncbi:MAG: hypothetical protein ACF8GE_04685 [Phycisphaerales bacterium JB043]
MSDPHDAPKQDLIEYRHDVHSQFGEDGIIEEILRRLNITTGWFVEFGAWDGKHLSNSRSLFERGWHGVFIEGDTKKFADLCREYDGQDRIVPLNAWVGFEGEDRLDALLAGTPIPKDFDLLSIDIDSDDYHVWHALREHTPKIVVIETNYSFPYNVDFVQAPGAHIGSSALAIARLGVAKGYTLACYNSANAIFVRNDLVPSLALPNRSFAYLYAIGRHARAAGFFASEFSGKWHKLHDENITWRFKKLYKDSKRLRAQSHRFEHWTSPDQIRALFDDDGLDPRFGAE